MTGDFYLFGGPIPAVPRPAPDPKTVAARRALAISRECEHLLAKHGKRGKAAARARWNAWHEREEREAVARGLSVEALRGQRGARRRW